MGKHLKTRPKILKTNESEISKSGKRQNVDKILNSSIPQGLTSLSLEALNLSHPNFELLVIAKLTKTQIFQHV